MHIDVITDMAALERLRPEWDALYEADPESHVFLSWFWIHGYVKKVWSNWFILAAKPTRNSKNYVAIFPLQLRTESKDNGSFFNEIRVGGAEFADYSGVVAHPDHVEDAIAAFTNYIKERNWAGYYLKGLRVSDKRMRLFTKGFATSKFEVDIRDFISWGNDDPNSGFTINHKYDQVGFLNSQFGLFINLAGDFVSTLNDDTAGIDQDEFNTCKFRFAIKSVACDAW